MRPSSLPPHRPWKHTTLTGTRSEHMHTTRWVDGRGRNGSSSYSSHWCVVHTVTHSAQEPADSPFDSSFLSVSIKPNPLSVSLPLSFPPRRRQKRDEREEKEERGTRKIDIPPLSAITMRSADIEAESSVLLIDIMGNEDDGNVIKLGDLSTLAVRK